MSSTPLRTWQSPLTTPIPSRPASPSRLSRNSSFLSQGTYLSDSSTYHLNQQIDSSIDLLQYPRAAHHMSSHMSSRRSSFSTDYDGATACPTPMQGKTIMEDEIFSITKSHFRTSVNSFETQIDPTSYTVATLDRHDDVELLSPWNRRLYRLSPVFTFLAVSAYFIYYAYRIHCTILAQSKYHKTYIMAWLFIAAEGCVACE